MVTNAVLLETLAARHGIPLVSLGSSSNPQHLRVIPMIITATSSTSCTFALPQELDWGLAYQVAEVIMDIAAETGVSVLHSTFLQVCTCAYGHEGCWVAGTLSGTGTVHKHPQGCTSMRIQDKQGVVPGLAEVVTFCDRYMRLLWLL
jgi:hypothetical protein